MNSLFPDPEWMQARAQAVQAVAQKAGGEFLQDARKFVVDYLQLHGATSGEELTHKCKASGIVPDNDKAFGAVYAGLSRAGIIVTAGTVRRERGHGSPGWIWKLKG